jgi:hypothetical protein
LLYSLDGLAENATRIFRSPDAEVCANSFTEVINNSNLAVEENDRVAIKTNVSLPTASAADLTRAIKSHQSRLQKLQKANRLDDFLRERDQG